MNVKSLMNEDKFRANLTLNSIELFFSKKKFISTTEIDNFSD
jgi:hypothetical protein